jgi:hypothetical protein
MSHQPKTLDTEMSIEVEYRPPLSPRRRGDERGGMVEIECAFCRGEGIDPFKILSPFSLCPVCGGRKSWN